MIAMPSYQSQREGRRLGIHEGVELQIQAVDERRLKLILSAVDQLFKRCEETVSKTARPILCWLYSLHPNISFHRPFRPVNRSSTKYRYRRVFKKFLIFAICLFLLDEDNCRAALKVTLTSIQRCVIARFWDDPRWRNHLTDLQSLGEDRIEDVEEDQHEDEDEDEDDDDQDEDEDDDDDDQDEDEDDDHNDPDDEKETKERKDNREEEKEDELSDERQNPEPPSMFMNLNPLTELILQLSIWFATEEFTDGQPASSLLVYYSGLLGFSGDGTTYKRARDFTSCLSALIHQLRLLFLEWALPYRAYPYIGRESRPRQGHLTLLKEFRQRYTCHGSLTPLIEFISLRDYGRKIAHIDGPTFRVSWSDDGETVSYEGGSLQMNQFRALGHYLLDRCATICRRLMYGWEPDVQLGQVRDDLNNSRRGYSFVSHPANRLSDAYLTLSTRACIASGDGLLRNERWVLPAVGQYLKRCEEMLQLIMAIFYCLGGQGPRATELLTLELTNGSATWRGVYAFNGYMMYISRYHKSRHITDKDFQVVRFLPEQAGKLVYYYLVYIRRFESMLRRECQFDDGESNMLFSTGSRVWITADLTRVLRGCTEAVFQLSLGVRLYRQISIAITEKHVRRLLKPLGLSDDWSSAADLDVVFAWQSGHRPMQRGETYGLDGAFPDSLQPALLRVYEWASTEWHRYLGHRSTTKPGESRSTVEARPATVAVEARPNVPARAITEVFNYNDDCSPDSHFKRPASPPANQPNKIRRVDDELSVEPANISGGMACMSATGLATEKTLTPGLTRTYYLAEHKILLCLVCKIGMPPGKGIETHLRNVHKCKGEELKVIVAYASALPLQDPHAVQLPGHGSAPIPQLDVLGGYHCLGCGYLTASRKNITEHWRLSQHHDSPKQWERVSMQTFSHGRFARYWVVEKQVS
jgi:hypothetical protein